MMDATPAVDLSLVVCTVGRPDTFRRLLGSLRSQLRGGLRAELIVVDQSGRDETLDALRTADLPCPYRHIRAEIGLSRARNTGLRAATGRYVMFPDDDVWFVEPMLVPAVALLDSRPELAAVCSRLTTADGSDSMLRWAKDPGLISHRNHHRRSVGAVIMVRRDAGLDVGGFDEVLGPGTGQWYGSCEDADFLLRLIESGRMAWYDPNLSVYHRDTRLDSGADTTAKSLSYGCGQGRMWRTRDFGTLWVLFLLLRRVVSSVVVSIQGHPEVGRARRAWVRGALNGLMDRPPADLAVGVDPIELSPGPVDPPVRPPARELVGSLAWRAGVTVAGIAATVVLLALVARRLATSELVVFYGLLAALAIVPILGRLGMSTKGLQEISRLRSLGHVPAADAIARRTMWSCLGPSIFVGLVVAAIVVSPSGGRTVSAILLAATMLAADSLRQALSDVFLGLGRIATSSLLSHSIRAAALAIVVALDRLMADAPLDLTRLLVLMVSTVLVLLGVGLVLLARVTREARHAPDHYRERIAATAAITFLIVDLVSVLISRGDVWLAGAAFDADPAASYGTASVLAKQIGMPIGLLNVAFAPVAARLIARRETADLERVVRVAVTALAVLLLPVLVVALVAGDRILSILYGAEFADGHRYLAILLVGNVAIVALGVGTTVLVMARRQRLAMWLSLGWLAVIGPIATVAAFTVGPTALAVASSVGTVGLIVQQAVAAWVVTGVRLYPKPSLVTNLTWRRPRTLLAQARQFVG